MDIQANLRTLSLSFRARGAFATKTTQGRGSSPSQRVGVEGSPLRVIISNRNLELLDFGLSYRKQKTREFLIDNFEAFFVFFKLPVFSISRSAFRAPSLQPPTFRHPNRQCPELESPLTHRKQRMEDYLIANFGAMFISRCIPRRPASVLCGSHLSDVVAETSSWFERAS